MRAWFMGKLAREKLLLLVFLVGTAIYWVSSVTERVKQESRDLTISASQLEEQARWLNDRERIEAAAKAAVQDLDGSRTFNSVRLSAELNTIAAQAGIATNLSSDAQPTQQTAQFSVHTVDVSLKRVPWENLVNFYNALSERAPYISIEQFVLEAVRSDPSQLNAKLTVSSVEIAAP
ncbi:MAG: hypothetical protein J6386_10225 [Candidatus Synoicihabitans palmerolidicus]|nr:hypothetical protein [Candidatus Synoicihabitans palmerolidicus]